VRVCFAGDPVRTLALRGSPTREARYDEVEAVPVELAGLCLPLMRPKNSLKDLVNLHKDAPEALNVLLIVGGVLRFCVEWQASDIEGVSVDGGSHV
jgi:hypothetical protein